MSILKVTDVKKSYGDNQVLHGIDLVVKSKEVYGLLGPNGAGKSTFLNIIVNLITDYEGQVEMFGQNISKDSMAGIGFVPQDLAIYEDLSAYQNVKFFGSLYNLGGSNLSRNAGLALEMVGLWDQRHKNPSTFSGGMKRRLNIACSIVHNPSLIILDEPTVGIDPQSRNYILESIKTLNKKGATIIYTSHYMEEVETICSKVAIIDTGRIVEEGTISETKEKYQNDNCYECILESGINVYEVFPARIISKVSTQTGRTIITFNRRFGRVQDVVAEATNADSIVSIGKFRPNLEDIFLTITGKALRDGDS